MFRQMNCEIVQLTQSRWYQVKWKNNPIQSFKYIVSQIRVPKFAILTSLSGVNFPWIRIWVQHGRSNCILIRRWVEGIRAIIRVLNWKKKKLTKECRASLTCSIAPLYSKSKKRMIINEAHLLASFNFSAATYGSRVHAVGPPSASHYTYKDCEIILKRPSPWDDATTPSTVWQTRKRLDTSLFIFYLLLLLLLSLVRQVWESFFLPVTAGFKIQTVRPTSSNLDRGYGLR